MFLPPSQIHPGSLDHGGRPLVACCLAAARDAVVPITVHLDHGAKEDDVMAALQLVRHAGPALSECRPSGGYAFEVFQALIGFGRFRALLDDSGS